MQAARHASYLTLRSGDLGSTIDFLSDLSIGSPCAPLHHCLDVGGSTSDIGYIFIHTPELMTMGGHTYRPSFQQETSFSTDDFTPSGVRCRAYREVVVGQPAVWYGSCVKDRASSNEHLCLSSLSSSIKRSFPEVGL